MLSDGILFLRVNPLLHLKAEFCLDPSWQFLSLKQGQTCSLNEEILFECSLWLLKHTCLWSLCSNTGSVSHSCVWQPDHGARDGGIPSLWQPPSVTSPDHNRIQLSSQPSCWRAAGRQSCLYLSVTVVTLPSHPSYLPAFKIFLVCSSQTGSLGDLCMNTCTKSTAFSERQLSRFNKMVLWQKTLIKHTQKQTGGRGKATVFNGASDVDIFGHVEHQFPSDIVEAEAGLGHPAGIPLHGHVVEGSRDFGLGETSMRRTCYHHLSHLAGVSGHFCRQVGLAKVSWSKRGLVTTLSGHSEACSPQNPWSVQTLPHKALTMGSFSCSWPRIPSNQSLVKETCSTLCGWPVASKERQFFFQAHCLLSNTTLPTRLENPFRHPSLIPAFLFPDPHNNLIPLHQREHRSLP